jgi:5-formyltetrahydrofolate cyclo-ligase
MTPLRNDHKIVKSVVTGSKDTLRRKILNLLRRQKEEDRRKKSRRILDKLFATQEFKDSKIILFYASFDGEVDTFEMMKQAQKLGKKIALPTIIRNRTQKRICPTLVENFSQDLRVGPYGIKEPQIAGGRSVGVDQINLIIVPGVAFDRSEHRLGRGRGYYDRFLDKVPPHIPTFGLAFDFQIVDSLPHQELHDVRVSRVIAN